MEGLRYSCEGGDKGVIRDSTAKVIQRTGAPEKHITRRGHFLAAETPSPPPPPPHSLENFLVLVCAPATRLTSKPLCPEPPSLTTDSGHALCGLQTHNRGRACHASRGPGSCIQPWCLTPSCGTARKNTCALPLLFLFPFCQINECLSVNVNSYDCPVCSPPTRQAPVPPAGSGPPVPGAKVAAVTPTRSARTRWSHSSAAAQRGGSAEPGW